MLSILTDYRDAVNHHVSTFFVQTATALRKHQIACISLSPDSFKTLKLHNAIFWNILHRTRSVHVLSQATDEVLVADTSSPSPQLVPLSLSPHCQDSFPCVCADHCSGQQHHNTRRILLLFRQCCGIPEKRF